MTDHETPDLGERQRALDPRGSFIVQAPAGSGKTELLTQRFLRLLATVESPEAVVAITFTRKAAAEMRSRILSALEQGGVDEPPAEAHARTTWELARAAVHRDREQGWGLLAFPGRLRVQTIDSLCATLTRQMPVISRFGGPPATTENAETLYREAARNTVALIESDDRWADAVELLLEHLGNDLVAMERLLGDMLGRRDQWLPHVNGIWGRDDGRALLEEGLARAVESGLAELVDAFPAHLADEVLALGRYAAKRLPEESGSPIAGFATLEGFPGRGAPDVHGWLAVVALLLTKPPGATWRKRFAATEGFPAPSEKGITAEEKVLRREMKERAGALVDELAGHEGLEAPLDSVGLLPPPRYSDRQWAVIASLLEVLRLAAAQLRLVFQEQGEVDFTEVASAALEALGPTEAPTDLALSLDYRIEHLLVDEFQDTSVTQYELLRRLTAGWMPEDGRTLFVVGDPMQSIYRFREAEVGLYLRTRGQGLGDLRLEPLNLSANFRSAPEIVQWVNAGFARLMPRNEDIAAGAVTYASAWAARPTDGQAGVEIRPRLSQDSVTEAADVADIVGRCLVDMAGGNVAVLVRARRHAVAVGEALREAGVRFQAVDIEGLGARPAIRDLQSLTRALLHPADRVAWLALLRAPWCGLRLADLYALVRGRPRAAVWDLVVEPPADAGLSEDGLDRLACFRRALVPLMGRRRRMSLAQWVESAWLRLGGPATVTGPGDLDDARVYLGLLARLDRAGEPDDLDALDREVERLYASPDPEADARVQIMTIHKAKGLEFDAVILPGLGYQAAVDRSPLMQWMEIPRSDADSDLILAPIRGTGAEPDPVYRYLNQLDREKARYEVTRLLYVAATRAKRRLYLSGHADFDPDSGNPPKPRPGSLLEYLWPVVEPRFLDCEAPPALTPEDETARPAPLRRLASDWRFPAPAEDLGAPGNSGAVETAADQDVEFSWAGEVARHVGTVVHRMLEAVADQGVDAWGAARVAGCGALIRRLLEGEGVGEEELDEAAGRVAEALVDTLADARGRWILDGRHENARSEYPISGVLDGRVVNATLDRTFVDADGTRWIIDYKTGLHGGGDREGFLQREQERYRPQLERYRRLMRALEQRPVRIALYFPLMQAWREYD